jgi:hypothetical protein
VQSSGEPLGVQAQFADVDREPQVGRRVNRDVKATRSSVRARLAPMR